MHVCVCACICMCVITAWYWHIGSHLITAANFCMNGKLAVVGTYDGRCMFYDTEVTMDSCAGNGCVVTYILNFQHLKYHTQIHVKSRHGKNKGRKISGVEPLPGEDKVRVHTGVYTYMCVHLHMCTHVVVAAGHLK